MTRSPVAWARWLKQEWRSQCVVAPQTIGQLILLSLSGQLRGPCHDIDHGLEYRAVTGSLALDYWRPSTGASGRLAGYVAPAPWPADNAGAQMKCLGNRNLPALVALAVDHDPQMTAVATSSWWRALIVYGVWMTIPGGS